MQSTAPLPVLAVSPSSLAAAFAHVPDPRRAASIRYPLPAILALAVSALLANHLAVLAIAEWGARQRREVLAALGFPSDRTPCQSTLQRLFRQLDGHALAVALTACLAPSADPSRRDADPQGVAIDGTAHRGRLRFPSGGGCPVHALSALCHDDGMVLAHEPIASAAGTDKGEAELTVAPALLHRIAWHRRVLTGDALFCQRNLWEQVCDAGGDYVVLVKANQGRLYQDIQLLFDPPAELATVPLADRRLTRTVESGHGRTREIRELVASTDLTNYLEWPNLQQVFRLARTWREHGRIKPALHYGITSLPPEAGSPERLLALKRGHGAIENRRHRRKDVPFGEDASRIHTGQGPTVLARLRDAAISLLHRAGVTRVAARLRLHSQEPARAVALVVGSLPTDA